MLKGRRVYLRKITIADADTLFKWGQDPHYQKTAGFAHYQNFAQAQQAAAIYNQRKYSYGLCLKRNQQLIGTLELYERGIDKSSGLLQSKSLGFLLDKAFEHHGYMTEGLKLLISYAFTEMKQEEIWANTFTDNLRSQHLLKKLGFKYMYSVDYRQISEIFSYSEKYYLLKRKDWIKIEPNEES